ncbi:MAG: ABC transporter ATP-binding protein [Gracilibacter sp. BRH_c7a]|nr:MAG: ABC transporter ATP-binding protein [Gracilibacter sp. BRH_c7a]
MELCRMEKVSKIYAMGEEVRPLNNISLNIEVGDFLSVQGPSGMGKSTLLYVMSGLLKPSEGDVFIKDINIRNIPDDEITDLRKKNIGFIFQETNLFQALTVEENLRFVLAVGQGKNIDQSKIDYYIQELGLAQRRNFLPNQLSVGQRRRLVAARALINDAPLILADEPTNDLDDGWAGRVMELLTDKVQEGGAVVMVTHNSYWAEKAGKHYTMQEGSLVLC